MKPQTQGIVVFIPSDRVGRGDDELGLNLMMNFIYHLSTSNPVPDMLVLMNAGVKLAVQGSELLDELKDLQGKGTRILACGTCLDFFGIREKLTVGVVSNMAEIAKTLLSAGKVITV
ncbi:MAG: hypothetical protein Kow0099_25440 [Candidatus Abyssubacteria bacterium]